MKKIEYTPVMVNEGGILGSEGGVEIKDCHAKMILSLSDLRAMVRKAEDHERASKEE